MLPLHIDKQEQINWMNNQFENLKTLSVSKILNVQVNLNSVHIY